MENLLFLLPLYPAKREKHPTVRKRGSILRREGFSGQKGDSTHRRMIKLIDKRWVLR